MEEEVRNSTDLPTTLQRQFFISCIYKAVSASPEHLSATSGTHSELEFTAQSSPNLELQPAARQALTQSEPKASWLPVQPPSAAEPALFIHLRSLTQARSCEV